MCEQQLTISLLMLMLKLSDVRLSYSSYMDDLNTSDHLPLLVDMMYAPCQEEHMEGAVSQRIDWDQAR